MNSLQRVNPKSLIFFIILFTLLFVAQQGGLANILWANGTEKQIPELPSLDETIQIALKHNSDQPPEEIIFSVKENYYLIQLKYEQLEVVEDVKGHFETAIEKAEEKMESDESDITQSQITKLKLGLAGSLNDIVIHESASRLARLNLGMLLGLELNSEFELADKKLIPVNFPYNALEDYLDSHKKNNNNGNLTKRMAKEKLYSLHEVFIELDKKKGVMAIANNNRKITRALLVTELANYDFGIGSSADLFEALMIYTRLLGGYYSSVCDFNISIAKLDKIYSN